MPLFNSQKPSHCGNPEWDGQVFSLDDPRIPNSIKEAAVALYQPGCTLHFNHTDDGGEWWLMHGDDLVEAFWLKTKPCIFQ